MLVMLIGILAAATVPLYLGRQELPKDAAAESDALSLGPIVRAAFASTDRAVRVTSDGTDFFVDGEVVLEVSPGVEIAHYSGTSAQDWCLELRHAGGQMPDGPGFRYEPQTGDVVRASCP